MAGNDEPDPIDTILSLEEQYYAEGHALGVKDGSKAGRTEGRLFGMQKGFEKFAAMGALAAQSAIWEARMNKSDSDQEDLIPDIPPNERLRKHIATLAGLTEFESLDTNNTEEAVADFDDCLKRAESKAKVISSIVGGEQGRVTASQSANRKPAAKGDNLEDFTLPKHLAR